MRTRRIGFITLVTAVLAITAGAVSHAGDKEGGSAAIGVYYLNDESAKLSRLKLYDYFAPGKAFSSLNYWTERMPGRRVELHLANPGDQDHSASFMAETAAWRFDWTQNRIFHAPALDASTRREYNNISLRSLSPDRTRVSLDLNLWRREGNLSATQPAGQTDRALTLGLQTPEGRVTAGVSLGMSRTENGADDRHANAVSAVLSINPGTSFGAVISARSDEFRNQMASAGMPKLKNESVGVNITSILSGGSALTGSASREELSSSINTSMALDSNTLSVGMNGGRPSRLWNVQYSFIDRNTSGIQTTDQQINRFQAGLRMKLNAGILRTKLRAGVTLEKKDTGSALSAAALAPLTSYKEQGSEKVEAHLRATARFFRKGNADLYARYRNEDFTAAPGITTGTTSKTTQTFGLTGNYPLGKHTDATYSYFRGRWERDLRIEWTGTGVTTLDLSPANDEELHTIGLTWPRGSKTDMALTATTGTNRSGGLVDAGRSRENDAQLAVLHRFDDRRDVNFSVRYMDYQDDLTSSLSETSTLFELSFTRKF